MNYNTRKYRFINMLDRTIKNNKFYFDLCNIGTNFYEIAKSTLFLHNLKFENRFVDISILFEFLLNNYTQFSIIFNSEKTTDSESVDVLCYLNVNLFIVKHLNNILKEMNINDKIMQECLDFNNFNFMDFEKCDNQDKYYKSKIIGVFNKIIEVHCNIVSKNT